LSTFEERTVEPETIVDELTAMKNDGFDYFLFVTCVDHLESLAPAPRRFELVYQLRDMKGGRDARVRTFLDGDPPRIASIAGIYAPANWDEREVYDLFGVDFEGHPELTRILLPDEWQGHPLRRDYPVGGEPVEFSEEFETYQTAPTKA
jgi:NADH-quinone oxidoreductase subunit C